MNGAACRVHSKAETLAGLRENEDWDSLDCGYVQTCVGSPWCGQCRPVVCYLMQSWLSMSVRYA